MALRAPTNHHTHCYLCDGNGKPVEYATVAAERGFSVLGFSSHAPLPFPLEWVMQRGSLSTYLAEIAEASRAVAGKVEILTGLEIDFIPGVHGPDPAHYPEIRLDYVIGSVHFALDDTGAKHPVDGPEESFADALERGFRGDAKHFVGSYYASVREMLDRYAFDILGHIDVVRKNNGKNRYFDTSEPWYRREVEATVDAAARNGCVVEVNTGALARGREALYPEPWVVELLAKRNVRMMVNTDAHEPDHLGFGYDRAAALLTDAGYGEYWTLNGFGWVRRSL